MSPHIIINSGCTTYYNYVISAKIEPDFGSLIPDRYRSAGWCFVGYISMLLIDTNIVNVI